MTKQFAMIIGWALFALGILNFFLDPIKLLPAHAVVHIATGLLGVILVKQHRGYSLWVGIVSLLLAVLGFAGMGKDGAFLGLIDLPTTFDWVHLFLGAAGLTVFLMARKPTSRNSVPPQA